MYFNRGWRKLSSRPDDLAKRYNWEFFAVLSGEAAPYHGREDKDPPRASSLWLLPPGTAFTWWGEAKQVERVVFHFATIDPSLRVALQGRRSIRVPLSEDELARVRGVADAVEPHYQNPTLIASLEFSRAQTELSLLVARQLLDGKAVSPLAAKRQFVAHKALAYYESLLPRRAKVAEVAEATGVSPSQLRRIFQEAFNKPPKHLFSTTQLEHAKTLAASSDLLIAEIAQQSGFVSASHLCHLFRLKNGVTFAKWRIQLVNRKRRPHLRAEAFTRKLEATVRKFHPSHS